MSIKDGTMMRHYQQSTSIMDREKSIAMKQVGKRKAYELPLHELDKLAPDIEWSNPPALLPDLSPVELCQIIGEWYVACSSDRRRHDHGQFFTPPLIARYMANRAGILNNDIRVLDPGAGTGILAAAICELAIQQELSALSITAYESDPVLYQLCIFTLNYAQDVLNEHGIAVSIKIYHRDFIEAMAEQMTETSLWSQDPQVQQPFDLVILNPPYFKVNQQDPRARLVKDIAQGRTNMYTMFMSLAASSLRIGGRYISITPRSFASGAYFKHFRHQFFNTITPELIHLFDSRRSTFEDADVLQENIILAGTKKGLASVTSPSVIISHSRGLDDLAHPLIQQTPRRLILDEKQKDPVLHLPTSDIDTHILQAFKRWDNYLTTYGLEISTGPVVPFRHLGTLTSLEKVQQDEAVPLLWLQHVRRMEITWPLHDFGKPQAVLRQTGQKLLVKNTTRIICAVSAPKKRRAVSQQQSCPQACSIPI
jgi:adenine-specific DNA-methyltransferase